MKRITLLGIVLFIASGVSAQSQRLVLCEHFTQASCGPCAVYNPAFNDMLNDNHTKIVSIKYQTNWPGTDPMNVQNPAPVATRVSYYGVSGVPSTRMDGGAGYSGSPANMTQAQINSRYNVVSPFKIDVDYQFTPTQDSIICHARIECTQAVTGPLVAHIAVIERAIYFNSPPGSNGEKEFEGVMKQMLPNASGTTLNTTWNVGDVQDITYSWAIKSINSGGTIYDFNQLACVAFVQNETTKQVLQTGYAPPSIANDAGVTVVANVKAVQCNNDIQPSVTVRNYSAVTPLTSFDLVYSIDGGANQTVVVSGVSIAPESDTVIVLPVINLSTGRHSILFNTANPNNATDQTLLNDAKSSSIVIYSSSVAPQITENFVSLSFPPSTFGVENVGGDSYAWLRSSAGFSGAGSAKINFYSAASGTIDNLYVPKFDFSNAITGAKLTFDLAHARYSATYIDRLKVNVSTNCGQTWTNVYDKSGTALATVTTLVTSAFTPTAAQWRNESISLDQFIGNTEVLVQFNAISGNGNNVYVDNVNISDGNVSVPVTVLNSAISLYPNPANTEVFLNFNLPNSQEVSYSVINSLGAVVYTKKCGAVVSQTERIDISTFAKGTYTISIIANGDAVTKRLNITE